MTMESSFKDDLKADSLDLFEMVMALEENYGIEIPTDDLGQLETVADVIDYIQSHKE
ncbi:MAG: acyl carrier protein [Lachnospiraceae bacterium]|nr:acyl carrier protein [Lachnospiraceae bacterium]